jgi:DNA-binding HxlR family transcriptional regulator
MMLEVADDGRLCATYLAAMEILAKPWNGMIIAVLEDGPLRYSVLSERVPAIGDRMLAQRLKELEACGLVVRSVEHGPPVRVSYALTEVGRGFRHVADAVTQWGGMIVRARDQAGATAKVGTAGGAPGHARPRAKAAKKA